MTDLIRRLEEAKEGSRELDAAIAALIRHPVSDKGTVLPDWVHRNFPEWTILQGGRLKAGCIWEAPHFTTNLQDAVSAVPEGMNWDVSGGHPTHVWATIWNDGCTTAENLYQVSGATPALALCIAILRAMEAKNE